MTTSSSTGVRKYAVVDERRFTIDARYEPYVCNEYMLARVVYIERDGSDSTVKNGVVLVTFPFVSPYCCWETSIRRNTESSCLADNQSASSSSSSSSMQPSRQSRDPTFLGVSFCSARWITDQVQNTVRLPHPVTTSTCAVFYSTTDHTPHVSPTPVIEYLRTASTFPYILSSITSATLSVLASETTTSSHRTFIHVLDAATNPPLLFKVPVATTTTIIRQIANDVRAVIGAVLQNPVFSRNPTRPDAFFGLRLFQRMMRLAEVRLAEVQSQSNGDGMLVELIQRCASASAAVVRERERARTA